MAQEAHTPGPWKLGGIIKGYAVLNGTMRDGTSWDHFARVVVKVEGEPFAEGEANARLIASAPELLDDLYAAEADVSALRDALYDALNLIDYMRCGDGSLPLGGSGKLTRANEAMRVASENTRSRAAIAKATGAA